MIGAKLAAQLEANALACAHPSPAPRWAHVRNPVTGASLAGYAAGDAADLQRQVAPFGIELVTIDGELAFFDGDSRRAYERRAAELSLSPAMPLTLPSSTPPTPWVDHPTAVQRPARFICAADARHTMTVTQERQADGSWSPDAARLLSLAGWVQVGAARFCGKTCAGSMRSALPPIVAVERLNDASWQPVPRPSAPTPVTRELAGREVPDRPARRLSR